MLAPEKQLRQVSGALLLGEAEVAGYEIHCGETRAASEWQPAIRLADGREDGVISEDGLVIGTYLHGLFDQPSARDALLSWAGLSVEEAPAIADIQEAELERLADSIEASLDCERLFPALAGKSGQGIAG